MQQHEFEAALDQNPHDWDLRRVYADWLDEQGQPAYAFGQRWMAARKLAQPELPFLLPALSGRNATRREMDEQVANVLYWMLSIVDYRQFPAWPPVVHPTAMSANEAAGGAATGAAPVDADAVLRALNPDARPFGDAAAQGFRDPGPDGMRDYFKSR